MSDEKRIIEINGTKMEIDMRTVRVITDLKVGDRVKVLMPGSYNSGMEVYAGVLIGFEDFQSLPTMVIAYIKSDYSSAELKFLYFNAKSEKIEVIASDSDYVKFDVAGVQQRMDQEILKSQRATEELIAKKKYFIENFNTYLAKEDKLAV